MIVLIVFNHLTTTNYLSGWRNNGKCGRLCRKKCENLDFRLFFRALDIIDYGSTTGSGFIHNT